MTTKALIAKNISKKLNISIHDSIKFTNSFVNIVTNNTRSKIVKITNFGTFSMHQSPERVGRNPKTKESYIIKAMLKLGFKPSNKVKEILN